MSKSIKRKRMPAYLKALILFLMILLLLVVSVFAVYLDKLDRITYADEVEDMYLQQEAEAYQDENSSEIHEETDEEYQIVIDDLEFQDAPPVVPDTETKVNDDIFNILLIGTDERTTHYSKSARSDSMILVSINKKLRTVRLVSLERGIGVPILAGEYQGQYDLLTHIFRWGGADLLIDTVEHCFKIEVNHYVRLNFAAVKKIVDVIGGIDMELSEREAYGLNEWAVGKDMKVSPGNNRLDGNTALRFARLRWIDSDWQRVGRQRKVILAVVDELKNSNLSELNDLADTVLPLIQTNLTKTEITELVLYAPSFLKSEFDQMTIPKKGTYGGMAIRNGGGAFAVDYEINNDLLYRFLYEGASSEELLAE